MGERSGLPKGGNRAHHQPGVDLTHNLVAETQTTDNSGGIVLDQHIDFLGQFFEDSQPLRCFGVYT